MTVLSFARSKLPRQNMMNDVRLFSPVLVLGNSMCIDKRQSIELCPPHTGSKKWHDKLHKANEPLLYLLNCTTEAE